MKQGDREMKSSDRHFSIKFQIFKRNNSAVFCNDVRAIPTEAVHISESGRPVQNRASLGISLSCDPQPYLLGAARSVSIILADASVFDFSG